MIDFVAIPEDRLRTLREGKLVFNRKLRDFLDVKFSVAEEDVEIEGEDPLAVMRTKDIIKAYGRGFEFEDALDLVDEDYILEIFNMSEFSGKSRNRQIVLKGRVIGARGKAKKMIEKYSGAKMVVYGKTVSLIGRWDNVRLAREAVELLLGGAKHSGVFKMLEERKIV